MSYIKAFLAALVVALAIIFMIQNMDELSHPLAIRLNLFFYKFQTTPFATYLVILVAFFAGLLSASLLGLVERFRLRGELRRRAKEIDDLNRELNSLRNLPITGDPLSPGEKPAPSPEREEELES
jgi:putative membrane protein